MLYTNNFIRLAGVTEYLCFKRLVLRKNLDLIQSLHVQWSYPAAELDRDVLRGGLPPYNIDSWTETWNSIAEWRGLKHVRVDIHKWGTSARRMFYEEGYYFAPLKVLGDHIYLEVCVSWEREETGEYAVPPDEETWPFLIRRSMEYCEDGTGNFRLIARE